MTQQNQKPDFIEPKEIIDFINKQNVSEEKALGLRLLRRAAETIAFQGDVIEKFSDRDQQISLQVAETLGEEFKQAFPVAFAIDDVLAYIAGMREQIGNLQQGIQDRDEIIRDYESPVDAVGASNVMYEDPFNAHEDDGLGDLPHFNHGVDPQVVGSNAMSRGSADGVSRSELVTDFKKFAYTMKGFVIAAAQLDPHGSMTREVENFIEDINNF